MRTVQLNLIGGFLGAGKTTTVRHLLGQLPPSERVAVVVNDFGEAEIDAAVLGEDRHTLKAIAGACVCCTAPEGFVASVRELLDQVDRILVEPTGLARPADLVDTLRRAPFADRLSIGPLVVVVDPHAAAAGMLPHDAQDQLAVADVVVVNRTDLATPEERQALRRQLTALWPGPLSVVETEHGRVPLSLLDWPEGSGPRSLERHDHDHEHDHDHDHGQQFAARSALWPPEVIFHRGRLIEAFSSAPPSIARLKGLLRTDEGVLRLDRAGGQVSAAPSGWRRDSRVDAIGTDADALEAWQRTLAEARLRPEEQHRRGDVLELAWPDGSRLFDRAALAALPDPVPDVSALVPGRAGRAARLLELLRAAGAPPVGSVVVVARDGFAAPAVPLSELSSALLVHSLGEEPLPDAQGGPFRLLVPGSAVACANVKGVVRIAVR